MQTNISTPPIVWAWLFRNSNFPAKRKQANQPMIVIISKVEPRQLHIKGNEKKEEPFVIARSFSGSISSKESERELDKNSISVSGYFEEKFTHFSKFSMRA